MLLGPDDDLGFRPQRILVNGASGSGKTTFAMALAERLGRPHTELDGLFHGPGWVPRESFLGGVRSLAGGSAWITDWKYSEARAILFAAAA